MDSEGLRQCGIAPMCPLPLASATMLAMTSVRLRLRLQGDFDSVFSTDEHDVIVDTVLAMTLVNKKETTKGKQQP